MAEIARVTLTVSVHLESEPGIDTPYARELPYDYLAIREVEEVSAELVGEKQGAIALVAFDGFEDGDPDDLLIDAVKTALWGLVPHAVVPHDDSGEAGMLEVTP